MIITPKLQKRYFRTAQKRQKRAQKRDMLANLTLQFLASHRLLARGHRTLSELRPMDGEVPPRAAGSPPRGASIDERLKDMPEGLDELATSNCARATAAVRPRRWPPEPEPSRARVAI